jgi:hypothetical protein
MRTAALVGVVGLILAPHAARQASAAEPGAYRAVVSDAEVKLRAGPSDSFPETGSLKRGSAVVVEREENGWLAVTAPSGSVSWIAFSFVEDLAPERPTPKNGVVEAEGEVTVAAGKAGLPQPLDVRREKIPQGTAVLLIGPPVEFAGKKWWPIAPPPGDVRYLPKTAVRYEKPAANNFTVRVNDAGGPVPPGAAPSPVPTASPLATVPGPGGATPAGGVTASKPAVNHPLWAQAEAAERDNRLADAEKAYFELAAIMNGQGGDHDIANLCYTRIHAIRERKRNASGGSPPAKAGAGAGAPLKTNVLQSPARDDRGVRAGTPTPLPAGAGRSAGTTVGGSAGGAGAKPPAADGARWTGPGVVRRSVLTPDGTGKPAYALETAPGVVKAYVIGGDGVNMENYLGKRVEVYGEPQTRGGLSKPYIVASKVEPAQ